MKVFLHIVFIGLVLTGCGDSNDSTTTSTDENTSVDETPQSAFVNSEQYLGVESSHSIALMDLDYDNDLDLLVANEGSFVTYKNDGNGSFTQNTKYDSLSFNQNYRKLLTSDIDNDGDKDVVSLTDQHLVTMKNNGSGYFSFSYQIADTNMTGLDQTDIDGDGRPDLVIARRWNNGNKIYLNDGTGNFYDSGQSLGTGDSTSVQFGDLNNDNKVDIAVGNTYSNRIYINNGSNLFIDSGQVLGTSYTSAISLGDVDGDGDLDMVCANLNQPNKVFLNNGIGTFFDSGQSLGNDASTSVKLADIDGDTDLDMIVGNSGANRIYLNDGLGIFTDLGETLGTNMTSEVEVGDIDGDNDVDVIEANLYQSNEIYFNEITH